MFSTVESSIAKSGKALAIFKKDWHDILYDFKNTKGLKNKFTAAFSTGISNDDINALKYYNAQIRLGVKPQTAFYRCLSNSSSAAQNLAVQANGAAASEELLTIETNQLTLAQKASAAASKALGVALKCCP